MAGFIFKKTKVSFANLPGRRGINRFEPLDQRLMVEIRSREREESDGRPKLKGNTAAP